MFNRKFIDDYIEEKLLHTHTIFLGVVKKVKNAQDIDVQPLTLTKQKGKNAKKQALLTGLPCIDSAWKYISVGVTVVCAVCERDITEARNGKSALPSLGRHQMKDSIIIGTLNGIDQSEDGSNENEEAEDFGNENTNKLFKVAEKYLGMPYTFGGTPPKSFDCSAYVCWVFSQCGYNLPRTTAQGIYSKCKKIPVGQAQAGDLIFFTKTYNTSNPVTHVGIYAGNDKMIHCCSSGIMYSSIKNAYWKSHLYGFGRL